MEQVRRTTAEALTVLDAVMSSIDHDARGKLSAPERLVLMKRARSFQDRAVSLACVLTDEASNSSVAATGTPITSLIGLDEGRDSGDAARQVFQARDLARHEAVKQAALAGTVSSRHAAAIGKGMAQLPPELTAEQKLRAEQAFLDRANKNTPKRLAELAPQVLAEVAPNWSPPWRMRPPAWSSNDAGRSASGCCGGAMTVTAPRGSTGPSRIWRRHP